MSVVIPAYNAATTLGETLASIHAQTVPPAEIIVIDDGSSDDTATIAKSFNVKLIMQANAGVAQARNAGVRQARGDLIAFLDADDVWHPRKLELQLAALGSADFICTGCYAWPGPVPTIASTLNTFPIAFEKLVIRNRIVTSTVLVRRAIVPEFDARLQGPEDYDLWLRILQHHAGLELPMPLAGYRSVSGSLSKNAERMEAGMALILEKLDAAGVFTQRRGLRRKAYGYFHYSCAYMHHIAGQTRKARRHLLQSLWAYPGCYNREDVRYPLGRLRLLLKTLRPACRSL